ncbi:transglycosylase SLT domain-containing protein [candidate division WOR-3 bacterium]|nr:transglycosylase SLT domain-containing protein [candidate division WOR-3 bacterium]
MLKIYESRKDKKNIKKTAWKLVKKYPESEGAYYSLHLIKPKTKSDRKSLGKVYYYHGDYSNAIKHFKKSTSDNAVNYYMGRIYYSRKNYSESLKYFSRSNWSAAYYYRGRIYENLNLFSRAIVVYDSLYTFYKDSKYAKRGYKRKAFLLEDIGDTLKAVETFLKINEKNTKFRAAMQLFRVGKLNKADTILMASNEPEFVYWRTRIGERLGKPTEGLKDYLLSTYPLSYYTLVRNNEQIVFDATSLEIWVRQLGDSLISFGHDDSLHLKNAIRYFNLNEVDYAIKELGIIEDKNPQDLLYLSKLCAQYGADRQSIIYGLRLKKLAKKNSIEKMPIDLFKLMYPIRYAFSITDQQIELSLCLAMIWQESLFDPEALSPANAKGLMQIIPPTARAIASDLKVQSYSLDDPKVSIRFGCYYFSKLLNDFNSVPLSLAGYNAGPVRAKKWIKQDPNYEIDEFIELIPYNETRNYVKSILNRRIIYKKLLGM